MPPRDRTPVNPTRADVDARIGETFLALNQIAAALALIERSCSRVLDELQLEGEAALEHALALRVASLYAHATLEQIGDVSDTMTTVLRFLAQQKMRESIEPEGCVALAGSSSGRG